MEFDQVIEDGISVQLLEEKRSIRRHHIERLNAKRAKYFGTSTLLTGQDSTSRIRTIGRSLQTPSQCSCWMCNRPRKTFAEPTIQEVGQDQPGLHLLEDA